MASIVAGDEFPYNWPWRGTVLHSCCGGADESDLALLASYGANALVLNINARLETQSYGKDPETAWDDSLQWLERMLDAARIHNVTAIIRLTKLPIDAQYGIREYSAEFWDNPQHWGEAVRLAGELAERFTGRGDELGAYAILTEPSYKDQGQTITPPNWDHVLQEIIGAVRTHDRCRHIVISTGPGGLAANYRDYVPLNDPRLIYNAHMYLPYPYTHQGIGGRSLDVYYPGVINGKYWDATTIKREVEPVVAFENQHKVPILIGEFGSVRYAPGSVEYLSDLIDAYDRYDWGWIYFSYKGTPLWDFRATLEVNPNWSGAVLKAAETPTPEREQLLKDAWEQAQ